MINKEGSNPPSVGFGKPPETNRIKGAERQSERETA